ncbi:hypothetical protein QO010_004030 [Caulobacter ginsengisoli]|uniref:Uncharacterized protein n=1 Tax=Caulobacter ginsengisoli TaxID=400775 RepID=A0ABU0IW53_9CAUL|nr:hypothetical protein [Caulobacter ginsengisoli]MDQ0466237.1 hypothetical protein [Caulobacter ginsengisoli]
MSADGAVGTRAGASTELANLYTPLASLAALHNEQSTRRLIREVLSFSRPQPRALQLLRARPLLLFRALATPNFETLRFLDLARRVGRPPLILELRDDWFTPTVNLSKRRLGKLRIYRTADNSAAGATRSVSVVSFNERGRQRISDMICGDGTPFIDMHHGMLSAVGGEELSGRVIDIASLCQSDGPRSHYERIFAFCTCFGALAETFSLSGPEGAFTTEVVLPAFEATIARFGARPAVTELLPHGSATDPHWESYPASILPLALKAAGRR